MAKFPLTRCVIASVLLLVCIEFPVDAQSPAKTTAQGVVTGKVTIKGKPAPGIFVAMRPGDPGTLPATSFSATTDQDGNYRITKLPAGSYTIGPNAAAYVLSAANSMRNQTVVLNEGETVEGIDFALVRGGVITGKVTDADGRPVIAQRVNLVPVNSPGNAPRYVSSASAETDDRGVYRIFGIGPGRYTVAAGEAYGNFSTSLSGRATYAQTFYPSVSDAAKATTIEVKEGSEASNIDISVEAAQTFSAIGRVVDGEDGQPIRGARLGLRVISEGRTSSISSLTATNSQGEFRLEHLQSGKYAAFLVPEQGSDWFSASVNFEIRDESVSDLVVKAARGASLTGVVVIENSEDKAVLNNLRRLSISAYIQSSVAPSIGHSVPINPDGSFTLTGVEPGLLGFSLFGPDRSLTKRFNIARIEREGNIEGRTIEIKGGDRITGVRVVVAYGSATVRGQVKLENRDLPEGSQIYLRITKGSDLREGMVPPQVDSRGRFIIEGIPGGVYEFEAVLYSRVQTGRPPSGKLQVNVADGAISDITITVAGDPSPPNPPNRAIEIPERP